MRKWNISIWGIVILIGLLISLPVSHLKAVEVPQGPAPVIRAQEDESERIIPFFHLSDDGPPLRPNHPPIDQILPMDMPDDTGQAPVSTEPLAGILYDAETDEIRLYPIESPAESPDGFIQGGAYNGADGGPRR